MCYHQGQFGAGRLRKIEYICIKELPSATRTGLRPTYAILFLRIFVIFAFNLTNRFLTLMSVNFELSPLIITLLSVFAVSVLVIATIYCPYIRRVARRKRECELTVDDPKSDDNDWPDASIIVYSQNETERLENFLQVVLGQNYAGNFEVVVVNEGDSEDIRNSINALQLCHHNLYLTFTPDGARNLSRKKLALTLGIKAARHEVVVLTTVDAIISSNQWLTKIMRHFRNPQTGIVLGYTAIGNDSSFHGLNRAQSFYYTADSVEWLSSAIGRRPFRGTELNLAYRRELFFANKGFSRSLNLHFGDDDIFISEIATRDNTSVELSPESIVRYQSYNNSKAVHDSAIRHLFTERFIKNKPIERLAVGETAMWTALLSGAAAIVFDYTNIVTIASVATLIIASLTDIAFSWRKSSSALEMRRLTLTAPWFALIRPFHTLSLKAYAGISKQKKYTWD